MIRLPPAALLLWLLFLVEEYRVNGLSSGGSSTSRSSRPRTSVGGGSTRSGRGGRGSTTSSGGRGSGGGGKNKQRKQNTRRKAEAGQQRKLQADADFFWDLVDKRSRGIDISGVSGKPWHRPSRKELFGHVSAAAEYESSSHAEIEETKVTRSGGAMDIPSMDDGFNACEALPDFVLDNLIGKDRMAYTAPSPIQQHCVPLGLAGKDVLASAQTGSGKTVGFLLPLIASVAKSRRSDDDDDTSDNNQFRSRKTPASPAALILAPTRELALQIDLEIEKLTFGAPPPVRSSMATRWSACCYGGATARPQLEALASGVEILVATPGRLADFLDRDLVSLSKIKFLVLDEADRMLDMGFEPQLNKIVEGKDMPRREDGRQTLLFSATFPIPLQVIAQKSYLRRDYAHIAVGKVGASNKAVEQRLVRIEGNGSKQDKIEVLLTMLKQKGKHQQHRSPTILFVNKKHVANWVARMLTQANIKCSQIHGDRSQGQRETALAQFRKGNVDVLVATDAVSRGIDIQNVAHVIQFDLPFGIKEFESYTHRIGRTGRAGKTGVATSFYVPGHQPKVGNAELWSLIKESFDESGMELPDWFLEEQGPSKQKRQRRSSSSKNDLDQGDVKNGRAPGGKKKDVVRRPPPRLASTPRSVAASGLKKPRKQQRLLSHNADDAELKTWLEDQLREFKSR